MHQLMLKISERVFSHVGNSKGKYQSLVHSHCRLMAWMVNNLDKHEVGSKTGPVITHELI